MFYQLHLLDDKHCRTALGGVAIAMAADVAEITRISRPPRGWEDTTVQLFCLMQAHELILAESREAAHAATSQETMGPTTYSLRANEFQVFISEQLSGTGLVAQDEQGAARLVLAANCLVVVPLSSRGGSGTNHHFGFYFPKAFPI